MRKEEKSIYAATWDRYVTEGFSQIQDRPPHRARDLYSWQVLNTTDDTYTWPGDEWGDADDVSRILDTCLMPHLPADTGQFCEIASGAGRFTDLLLRRYPEARFTCFDISRAFLDQMQARFPQQIAAERMRLSQLTERPEHMYQVLDAAGLVRKLDCVFSFDAMVHVELHTVLIYLATAAAVLKPDGLLTMNVADATNPHGFQKLIFNAPGVFRQGGQAGMHFQFMSADILNMLLTRLGFSAELHDCNGRDLFFSARLTDPDAAQRAFRSGGSRWWFHE